MKRFFLKTVFLLTAFFFQFNATAQIGGVFSVPGDFPTIAAAINTLNVQGVAAAVTINIAAGYTETAVSGGYKLYTIPGASATNSVIMKKNGVGANPLVYAYSGGTATPASSMQDGIWWFIGTDYVTIDGVDLVDQNTLLNSTMEFGFGFFRTDPTNACQYNTIKNCAITLNRNNSAGATGYSQSGSKGIYLSACSATANTVFVNASSAAGSMSYNRFYSNTILNCHTGISIIGSGYSNTIMSDQYNDVGGYSISTGNTITNFGGGPGFQNSMGIFTTRQYYLNVAFNSINNNNGSGADHSGELSGIYTSDANDASLSIKSNTISLRSAVVGSQLLYGILNSAGAVSYSSTITISKNVFPSYTFTSSGTYNYQIIYNNAPSCRYLRLDSNTVDNVSMGSGTLSVISVNNSKETLIRADTIRNVSGQGARFNGISFVGTLSTTEINNNLIENVSWSSPNYNFYGIYGANNVPCEVAFNTIRNISYSSFGTVIGIAELSGTSCNYKLINNNLIYNFDNLPNSPGSTNVTGIRLSSTSNCSPEAKFNSIYSLAVTSTTTGSSGLVYGIDIYGGSSVSISKNKIAALSSNYGSEITGINLSGTSSNYAITNNLVGNIGFPNASVSQIAALSILSGVCSLYSNSFYLNATYSADPDFNSAVIRQYSAATLKMNNNILVNTSVFNGTGKTRVLLRNVTSLSSYSTSCNNNLLYAGVPSADNLLFDDGTNTYSTLAAFKGAVAPREALSVTENPPFLTTVASATNYLIIDPTIPTQVEGLAQFMSGYPTDYAGTARNTSTPDIGAWEGNYMQADILPPVVVATGFSGGDCSLSGRIFTLQVTDDSGVSTGSVSPRLYYRVNLGLYTSVQGTLISGTANSGVWSFSMTYSANISDVIRYFFALQDASPLANYSVFPSSGSMSSDINSVVIPPPAPYTYTVIAPASVSVNSGILCLGSSFTLVPVGGTSYTISGGSSIVSPTSDATYTVTGTGVAGCITSTMAVASISVVSLPTITVNSGTTCSNQSFTLLPSGATSYFYGGGLAVVNPSVTTSYTVVGIDLNGCSSNTVLSSVTVYSTPVILVNAGPLCEGSTATVTASGATTYTWSANTGMGNLNPALLNPLVSTAYTMSGSNANCSSSTLFTVDVNPIPVVALAASGPTLSCSTLVLTANTNTGNTWSQKAGFTGNTRQYAVALSIGNKGYIGLGYNSGLLPARQSDLWEYDVTTNAWSQKANFGGGQRYHAIAFSIGSKGYIGTGLNGSANSTSDFWEYNPVANAWTQKSNFAGGARSSATGFSIGNKGYVGAGYSSVSSSDVNDFWEYDPTSDTWTQKTNFPGSPRSGAAAFSIGTKGYMGIGNVSSSFVSDFYEYNPATNAWTSKAAYGMGAAGGVVAFSLGNRGYFATGNSSSSATNQTWEYNPVSNTWTQRADFGSGFTRTNAVAFSVGLKAFVVTGITNGNYMSDLWQYDPIATILWSNGITQKSITPLVSGIYSVAVTNVHNCSASATQSIGIQTYPTLSVTNSGGIICATGTRTLIASGASTYTWSANLGNSNASSIVITPTASTIYTVSSANGWCLTNVSVVQDVVLPATQSIVVSGSSVSCGASITLSTAATAGNIWTQKTSMATGRSRGITFSIADKAYIGTGFNSTNSYLGDFWEYDPATNVWTQKANFGGSARYGAVGMSIGGSGFVGTGYDGSYKNDFWEYNPVANIWTQKNNFGGGIRRYATCFVVSGKAYLGTGQSQFGGAYVDMWEYNPGSDSWQPRTGLGGGLYDAVAFSIGSKGYVCSGADAGGTPGSSLREFDPVTNAWTTKTSITSQRAGAAAFSIGNKAYVTGGNGNNDLWEYNPTTNVWTSKAIFAGPQRPNALAFTVANKGYITTGGTSFLSDLWEYDQGYAISWTGGVTISSLVATASGNYSLSLTDTRGCATTFNQSLTITPNLNILVSGPSSACLNSLITLTASGAASYTWSANAGNVTTNTVSVNPTVNTVYTLNAAANTCTGTITKSITVYGLPTVGASVSGSTLCAGMPLTLSGTGASTYLWSGGATNNSPFPVTASSSYTVTGTDVNGCSNTATTSVTVNPSPTVSVNSGTICEGQSFTMTPVGGLTYTYSGSGSATVSPISTSVYSVTGFAANGCYNVAPAVSTVTVYARPTVVAMSGTICAGGSFTINSSGAASYTYSGGSAVVAPAGNASYSVGGTSSFGCVSATLAVVNVSVNPIPTISVTNGTVCAGQNFTLTPSGASTYSYSSGSAIVAPSTNTFYLVSGTSALGCVSTSSATSTMSVLISPTLSVNSGTACMGQSFTLSPTGGITYTYSSGSAIVTPASTTIYTVSGFGSNGCPNASLVTSTVTVLALPVVTVSSGAICTGSSFTLLPDGALSYVYSGGSAIVSPVTTTSYSITGTSANGCVSTSPAISIVSVNNLPTLSISGSSSVCQGTTQIFTVTGASTYTWNTGGNGATLTITPVVAATYSVSGTDLNGCISSTQKNITLNPLPSFALSGNTVVCSGQATSLLANGTAITYTWSNGLSGTQISVSPTLTSIFTATGSNIHGCAATASILVFINSLPVVSINSSGSFICIGGSVTLNGTGANNYGWSGGVTNSVAFYPAATNIYTLTGTDVNTCSNSATVQVVVNPLPNITITARDTVCNGETITLTAGGANVYNWSTGEATPMISVSPTVNSSYSLTGTDINNCTASSSRTLVVVECTGLEEWNETIGITIYPNPSNGVFNVLRSNDLPGLKIEVYNNLSQLILQSDLNGSFSQLNLADRANGIYFLKISRYGNLIKQEKIIKAE